MARFWDVPLPPDEEVPANRSRFLRLHAAPDGCGGRGEGEGEQKAGAALGTAVIIHGGYWKNQYGLDDAYGNAGTASLAPFFLGRGFSAVELEYRRRDHEGGGWPGTNEDVLAALALIAKLHRDAKASEGAGAGAGRPGDEDEGRREAARALVPSRLLLVGHSAGGCLALWAAQRVCQEACPDVAVSMVWAMAPVADLVRGYELRISDDGDAVERYMKCTPSGEEGLEQYRQASPAEHLPTSSPTLVVYGEKDADVPPALIAEYARRAVAAAPERVEVVQLPEADHFAIVNASSDAWTGGVLPAAAAMAERCLGPEAAAALRG